MALRRQIRVVAALMRDPVDGRILITKRQDRGEFGGFWEFPGGKVEPGESDRQALAREIHEELGIDVEVGAAFYSRVFEYRNFTLDFHILRCRHVAGEMRPLGVADMRWVLPADLPGYSFPPADAEVVSRLSSGHNM